jgi:beta-N-acetylglucosaminidase/SH3-like domain-containing protein
MKKAIKKRKPTVYRKSGSSVKKAILPTFCFAVLSSIAFEHAVHAEQTTPTQVNNQVTTKYVNISSGTLNMRKDASTSSSVVAVLTKGTAVTVYSETNGWAKVEVNGQAGYVSSLYLSTAKPSESSSSVKETYTTKYVNIASGSLNLRTSATTQSSVVAKLSKGTAVQVYSEANGWAKVSANGKEGYINLSYLSSANLNSDTNTNTGSNPITNTSTNTDSTANQGIQTAAVTKYVSVSSGSLNLRAGATTQSSVVAKLSNGTAVQVYSEANGWAKVNVNGKDGYVNSSYLSSGNSSGTSTQTSTGTTQSAPTETSTKYVSVTSGSLNMRNGASADASIILKLSKGTEVKVYTESGGWSKIEAYGKIGYVSSQFLSASAPGSTIEQPTVQQSVTKYVNVDSGSALNLRKSVSTSSTILTKLTSGTEVKVYSESAGWAKVLSNGQEGYVRAEFLTENKPDTVSEAPQTTITKYVSVELGSSLNMRKSNSADSSILIKLARGVEVTVLSEADGWSKISAYGQEGYVDSQYLSADKPAAGIDTSTDNNTDSNSSATVEKFVSVIFGSSLNMRSEASTSSSIVSKLARGTKVTVLSEANGWSKIAVNDQSGFVSSQYLSAEEPLNPSTIGTSDTEYENYNISMDDMLKVQMAVLPQTDKKYNTYIRADALTETVSGSGIVKGGWNIRGGAGTDFWVVGQVKDQDTLKIISKIKGSDGYDWYQVVYDKTWVNASPEDVVYYLNPNNFINNPVDSLQFLNLSATANLDESEVNNRILAGKGILQGLASAFIQAGNTYGVNEIYLISHALLETGNGTSQLANGVQFNGRTVYNMYGIGAIDASPVSSGAQFAYNAGWFTPESAIIGGAQFIAKGYIGAGQNTLYKMRWNPASAVLNGYASHEYASDIGWAAKQVNQINNLYSLLNSYKLVLEIPEYMKNT